MTRKKIPTKDAVLLEALRANMNLLGELAVRYNVATRPELRRTCPPSTVQKTFGGCSDPRWPRSPRSSSGCCSSTPGTRSSASGSSTKAT